MPTEPELVALAERAARAAGAELMQRWGSEPLGVRTKSSPTDPVSAADLAAERAIRDVLGSARPGDVILGEEGGELPAGQGSRSGEGGGLPAGQGSGSGEGGELRAGQEPESGDAGGDGTLRWVVDPLDGTVNFLYGFPMFAVSVACEDHVGTLAGVVLDPVRDECFSAARSGRPLLNGQAIEVERRDDLSSSLVATGFAYDAEVRAAQSEVMLRLLPRVRDIRRGGSAALDLCWCACGRVDAYFERGLRAWDFAAGALICLRAGLRVRRLVAVPDDIRLPDGLLVAPPAVIDDLEEVVLGSEVVPAPD